MGWPPLYGTPLDGGHLVVALEGINSSGATTGGEASHQRGVVGSIPVIADEIMNPDMTIAL